MGRLQPFGLPFGEQLGLLWEEVKEGTFIWRDPSPSEKAEAKQRRRILFEQSAVPWVLNDLGNLLGFYDDVQDVVSFTRWNKKLFSPKGMAKCMKRQSLRGTKGAAAAWACFCMAGARAGKRRYSGAAKAFQWRLGVPLALGLRLFPAAAPIMWGLLAGQVLYSLTGVGIRLGAIVGASLETTFRSLEELGFPFGRDHNKANQIRRARMLRRAWKGVGASQYLGPEDRLTAMMGLRLGLDWIQPAPTIVLGPDDFPKAEELFSDPFGTIKTFASAAAAMLPNVAAYFMNDILDPLTRDLSKLTGGTGDQPEGRPGPEARATMKLIERRKCPRQGACPGPQEDAIRYIAWASARGLPFKEESLAALGFESMYGTLMDIRANLGFGDPRLDDSDPFFDPGYG